MAEALDILQISELTKSFESGDERLLVLNHIDLSVRRGQTLVVTGESGSGKSTLLNLVAGVDVADSGSIICDGFSVADATEAALTEYRNRSIGLVFQFHFLLEDFSAEENVLMPALIAGARPAGARARARDLLAEVRVLDRAHHFPGQLSGGERQRVAIARAMMNDPSLILADEPTGNLDEENSDHVMDLLFALAEARGKTLIVVTHDSAVAARGGRRLHLEKGSLRSP